MSGRIDLPDKPTDEGWRFVTPEQRARQVLVLGDVLKMEIVGGPQDGLDLAPYVVAATLTPDPPPKEET